MSEVEDSCQRVALAALFAEPSVSRAIDLVRTTDAETIGDMIELVQISAPSLHERKRALRVRDKLARVGMRETVIDDAGNVIARIDGADPDLPAIVLAAHLDSVFPRTTPLEVRQAHGRIQAPGIADNARGLAALIALARVLRAARVRPARPLLFVATAGEEGAGDLYGVKYLHAHCAAARNALGFIAIDGAGSTRIVHRAVGSSRLRVEILGPGGHPWSDRRLASPILAMATAVRALYELVLPASANATINVGRVGGGTSVNAVARRAWFELDLRAEQRPVLEELESRARRVVAEAVRSCSPDQPSGPAGLRVRLTTIGYRPTGETAVDTAIVRAARAATYHCGAIPKLTAASTDANIPMALGVPAIALGAGGEADRTHTLEEWYSNKGGPGGIQRLLLTILAAAGVAGGDGRAVRVHSEDAEQRPRLAGA